VRLDASGLLKPGQEQDTFSYELHVFVTQASAELTSIGGGSMAAEEVVGNWRAMQEAVAAKRAQVLAAGVWLPRSSLHSVPCPKTRRSERLSTAHTWLVACTPLLVPATSSASDLER